MSNNAKKVYKEYECPTCKKKGCYDHCNHCGKEIKWLNHLGDPFYETKNGRRMRYAFEPDDSVHRCMQKGTKDGNFYNLSLPDKYILDEYRTIFRIGSSAEFKCTFCNKKGDLPVMKTHHNNHEQFDCNDKLMAKFFKEKPKTYIDVKNNKLTDYT